MMRDIVFPKPLRKKGTIAIISPAGAVEYRQLETTIGLIKSKGYEPILGKNALGIFDNGYLYSGTEQERIDDINWAFNDSGISAVWASRGGYGCQHLLKHLDCSGLKKNPKWYIGYSDNTAIQAYLLKHYIASIHGQTVKTSDFGASEKSYGDIFGILEGTWPEYQISPHQYNKDGEAEGVLVGGNLALIHTLLRTPYGFDFQDKILFVEDIGELFYALDRMLMALDLADVLGKIKGLIVGGMTNMGSETANIHYGESFDPMAYRIVSQRLDKYNLPVVFGFPNGHIFDNEPLVLGARIKMKVTTDKVQLKYMVDGVS